MDVAWMVTAHFDLASFLQGIKCLKTHSAVKGRGVDALQWGGAGTNNHHSWWGEHTVRCKDARSLHRTLELSITNIILYANYTYILKKGLFWNKRDYSRKTRVSSEKTHLMVMMCGLYQMHVHVVYKVCHLGHILYYLYFMRWSLPILEESKKRVKYKVKNTKK